MLVMTAFCVAVSDVRNACIELASLGVINSDMSMMDEIGEEDGEMGSIMIVFVESVMDSWSGLMRMFAARWVWVS